MFFGLSKKEIQALLEAEEAWSGYPFSWIDVADRVNMPKQIVAFKADKSSGYYGDYINPMFNNSKFGQSLDPDSWCWIPTESLINREESMISYTHETLGFNRLKNKPFFLHKTTDGWVFLGKFDRNYVAPFNGQPLTIYDEQGNKLWTINENDLTPASSIDEYNNSVKDGLNRDGIKVAQDAKILRTHERLPSPWRIYTYEEMVALIGKWELSRMPKKEEFRYANLWIIPHPEIPVELPEEVGRNKAYLALSAFSNVSNASKIFKINDSLSLLEPKEEDENE